MAGEASYKNRGMRDRRAVLETDFTKGMMSTDGLVDEGYVKTLVNFAFEKENGSLVPRPGLTLSSLIFLDTPEGDTDFLSNDITLKATRECIEQGITYHQNLLGKMDDNSSSVGNLWLCTSLNERDTASIEFDQDYADSIGFSDSITAPEKHKAYFFTSGDASIHKVPLSDDILRRVETPIGAFAFGNSFYFFGEDGEGKRGLFRTVFNTDHYEFEAVTPKEPTVSEAVTYGYNMLLGEGHTYQFSNEYGTSKLQFLGILPYETGTEQQKLLMTPKRNQPIDLVCYFAAPSGSQSYTVVWEWRETTASDWTELQREEDVVFDQNTKLNVLGFKAPAVDMMVRISAYKTGSDIIEHAMVVGFDFTTENYGSAMAIDQKEYDLTTATGMASWNGRLIAWGVPEDPTILFISDYNEPSYFPYPNNIVVFDEPIIHAVEFMDNLAVFTTDKLYQVTLSDDGNSWVSTILQSHLNIKPWDRHLIQTVRNMLYFKSGNYYYMMVPKAQSQTGELALAPITTPITSFFDYFSVNVQNILRSTYGYEGDYELLTYYNYLDYDDIHNVYIYTFDEDTNVMHFDVIYNTVDRTWKVWVYEKNNFLFPYRHDATQTGQLATTSLIQAFDITEDKALKLRRVLQIFRWNKLSMSEIYLPFQFKLSLVPSAAYPDYYDDERYVSVHHSYLEFDESRGATSFTPFVWYDDDVRALYFLGALHLFAGFSKPEIITNLKKVYQNLGTFYAFRDNQFLDTGYRNDNTQYKKRYRELQLKINNLDHKKLSFGMEYILDGAPRKLLYKYDVAQAIDEFNPEYGIVYVDTIPYLEVSPDEIDLSNQWTIDQGLFPEISLWTVRISVSGKGSAPRFKLYSNNQKRFELLGINWISKIMHMR